MKHLLCYSLKIAASSVVIFLLFLWCIFLDDFNHNEPYSEDLVVQQSMLHTNKNPFAVVTLLSFNGFEGCWNARNYFRGVAKLGVSWRRHGNPNFDMVLMISHGFCHTRLWSFDSLKKIGWKIYVVHKPIHKSDESLILGNRYEHAMLLTKFYVWTLQYQMVLFMDADTFIVKQLPDLRRYKTCCANVHSLGMEADEKGQPTGAGVMVITPSVTEFQTLYAFKDMPYERFELEQAFLQEFYSQRYNRSKFPLTFISPPHRAHGSLNFSVIHYCGENKPWNVHACREFQHYCDLWYSACDSHDCI